MAKNTTFNLFRDKKPIATFIVMGWASLLFCQSSPENLTVDLQWRNIGPANMMGRISAVEALNTDYRTVLVATASGGVFKSNNAGTSWTPIFDEYGAGSIGAVAFYQPNPDIIWVGTGEAANRNSSAWGDGIYKSIDGGKTFENMGLEDTHQIAEIATHPTNPDIIYVAAVGHLWGNSGSRGLFKTVDGGKSWKKLGNGLPIAKTSGCTEIIMDPENPKILFAGFYERLRQPASFKSGGPNGGLFKSEDGGESWRKITNGLAEGDSGMIDVSIHLKNPEIMVMAYEADENIEAGKPGSGVYRSDDGGETWKFILKHAIRPFYHGQIQIDPLDDNNIYVVSRGFMISRDGGKTFSPPRWNPGGGDDHDMWIAPYDSKIMYMATDQGARLSIDGGNTFLSFNNMAIGQYYGIGVDMRDPYWVIGGLQDNGLWMGPSNSREVHGILNEHNTWVAEGDGFHAQIDPTDWRTLYTVNHVGFVARQNVETREHVYITPTPETITNFNDFFDPKYPETPNWYSIYPGEHWFFGEKPERPLLPSQFRFNWSSPFIISPNHPQTVYFGSNYLFKSTDRGDSWRIISPDLSTNDPALRNTSKGGGLTTSNTGGENHFTIITICESPLNDELIWVGTDDGNVQLSRNGGDTWENVKPNIPGISDKIWVSRVEASHFEEGKAYITLDNHRFDDNKPYVYVTRDFGKTWTDISSNLPEKYSVYVIKEDPVQKKLLFVGTEESVYTSLDDGKSWINMRSNLPTVAIHDLVIHPREADLIAGTHGRSIWIMDDISPLRQMSAEIAKYPVYLFNQKEATKWIEINTGRKQPAFEFSGQNPPAGAVINFYVGKNMPDSAVVSIKTRKGELVFQNKIAVHEGINRTLWPLDVRFPDSKEELNTYKTHLEIVIGELGKRVKIKDLKNKLKPIEKKLEQAGSIADLNEVRRQLVADFAGYAGGKPFFGAKPNRVPEPGTYEATIELDNQKASGVISVRADPLININH
jgi:photosystem II stability/assembly factor-like uncharacterized protein